MLQISPNTPRTTMLRRSILALLFWKYQISGLSICPLHEFGLQSRRQRNGAGLPVHRGITLELHYRIHAARPSMKPFELNPRGFSCDVTAPLHDGSPFTR